VVKVTITQVQVYQGFKLFSSSPLDTSPVPLAKAINLGNTVNSNFSETAPSITPDGKYLFFGRYNEEGGLSNFYWVSTEFIHKLKRTYFNKK